MFGIVPCFVHDFFGMSLGFAPKIGRRIYYSATRASCRLLRAVAVYYSLLTVTVSSGKEVENLTLRGARNPHDHTPSKLLDCLKTLSNKSLNLCLILEA